MALLERQAAEPQVISEELPNLPGESFSELDLSRPLGGPLWWNSLLWTNFPPLAMLSEHQQEGSSSAGSRLSRSLAELNTDDRLREQYVTFTAAREDLCTSREPPKTSCRLTVECMQYEGARDISWNFPLQEYIPKRDNHKSHDVQARRFWDNNVLHVGLNAEEFSDKIMPVGDIDAVITLADYAGDPTWGYYPCLMRIANWPFRVKKMGSFEGFGNRGHQELSFGLHAFDEKQLWDFLQGPPAMSPTGPGGVMELQGNRRRGFKFWAQLTDLDWLGPNLDARKHFDPEVPLEKGYVWFVVEESITVASTQKKGVRIRLLDEGILPAWLDLHSFRIFAGGVPLGFLSEADADHEAEGVLAAQPGMPGTAQSAPSGSRGSQGRVQVLRTSAQRSVVVENAASRLVFKDPKELQVNDLVDLGWALFDCCYRGASFRLGPKPGKWAVDPGEDWGLVDFKASGPPPISHGEGPNGVLLQEPKSDYSCERRLVQSC